MNAVSSTPARARWTRTQAEDFLFHEAELIDSWQLEEWSALFTADGTYLIPPLNDPKAHPAESLFLVLDDRHRLGERAKRLLKRAAHAEYPRSNVRHLIANVRLLEQTDASALVACNFVVYRSRSNHTEVFPGHAEYQLDLSDPSAPRIRSKRVMIDTDTLRDQRRISIIL